MSKCHKRDHLFIICRYNRVKKVGSARQFFSIIHSNNFLKSLACSKRKFLLRSMSNVNYSNLHLPNKTCCHINKKCPVVLCTSKILPSDFLLSWLFLLYVEQSLGNPPSHSFISGIDSFIKHKVKKKGFILFCFSIMQDYNSFKGARKFSFSSFY